MLLVNLFPNDVKSNSYLGIGLILTGTLAMPEDDSEIDEPRNYVFRINLICAYHNRMGFLTPPCYGNMLIAGNPNFTVFQ